MKQCFFTVCALLFLFGCKKQTDTIAFAALEDYAPLQVGRTLTYRLDSTIIAGFGSSLKVVSYIAKDSIESAFTDNQGRASYRVFRYTTDSLQKQPWQYKSTYYITPAAQSLEVVDDNNNRFIKLKEPVRNNFAWKGNTYIDTRSANSSVQYLDGWDYTYQNVDMPFATIKGMFDSTITVLQKDETIPEGPFDPDFYQQRNYSIEVYAKGIGLVYKDFLHWTWQTTPPPAGYEEGSYGIKLNLIAYK